MSKTENELMTEYGITCKAKTIYSYKQHDYERLSDALRYAEIDVNRCRKDASRLPGDGVIVSS
jgi:hypothetical protein